VRPAVLIGALVLTVSGAHGATNDRASCTLTRKLVVIDLDDVRHRHIIDHALDARRAGHPRILHIRRYEATANRRASLRGIPTKLRYGRDEYPPAMSDEGGKGADVRYILSAENRSAGSVMRHARLGCASVLSPERAFDLSGTSNSTPSLYGTGHPVSAIPESPSHPRFRRRGWSVYGA
jgi:Deoxyribonuclease NucA/NucB